MPPWLLWSHALGCSLLVFVLTLAPQHMQYETLVPSLSWLLTAGIAALAVVALVVILVKRFSIPAVRVATLIPVVLTLIFLLGFHGRDLDVNYSARPLAEAIAQEDPEHEPLATEEVRRDIDYGLAFYRNQPTVHYGADGVPAGEHLLVIRKTDTAALDRWLQGRIYVSVFLYDPQGLEVYRVYAKQ
jgi:hypothetical protein